MSSPTYRDPVRVRIAFVAFVALGVFAPVAAGAPAVQDPSAQPDVPAVTTVILRADRTEIRSWYRAWNGRRRALIVGYPRRTGRAVPLVVTAHPAGMSMFCDDGNLRHAARAGFALACVSGQGVATRAFSYGAAGQVRDLAAVPSIVRERAPNLPIDDRRTSLVGSSMGGTEALLVALRYPTAYDDVIALDPVTDLGRRFHSLPPVRRVLLAAECGGTPRSEPACFAARSPATLVAAPRTSSGRLTVWYSSADPVSGAVEQMPAFVRSVARAPGGRAMAVRIGRWPHGALWDRAGGRRAWLGDLGLRWPERASGHVTVVRLAVGRGRIVRVG